MKVRLFFGFEPFGADYHFLLLKSIREIAKEIGLHRSRAKRTLKTRYLENP